MHPGKTQSLLVAVTVQEGGIGGRSPGFLRPFLVTPPLGGSLGFLGRFPTEPRVRSWPVRSGIYLESPGLYPSLGLCGPTSFFLGTE